MPSELSEEAMTVLKDVLPAPLHSSEANEAAEEVDVGEVQAKDPVASYKEGVLSTSNSFDEDDDEDMGQPGGCAQM